MTVDAPLFDVPDSFWRHRRCQVCGGALSVVHSHLYVVQRQAWVKVGATDNLRRRINEIRRPAWAKHLIAPRGMDWYAPLHTLGVALGGGPLEHELHDRFSEQHAGGEWFWDHPDLRRWLREVT